MLSLIIGAVTGAWEFVLPAGIIMELMWLDVVPLGSVVPPLNLLAFWLFMPLCFLYRWETPEYALLPLFFSLLCAYLGSGLERSLRVFHNRMLDKVQCWMPVDSNSRILQYATITSIVQRFLLQMLLFFICWTVCVQGITLLWSHGWLLSVQGLTWPMLYAASALGAVLSLRSRRAYGLLAGVFCTFFVWGVLS